MDPYAGRGQSHRGPQPIALLDAYGVRSGPERTLYYRLLWDLSS